MLFQNSFQGSSTLLVVQEDHDRPRKSILILMMVIPLVPQLYPHQGGYGADSSSLVLASRWCWGHRDCWGLLVHVCSSCCWLVPPGGSRRAPATTISSSPSYATTLILVVLLVSKKQKELSRISGQGQPRRRTRRPRQLLVQSLT